MEMAEEFQFTAADLSSCLATLASITVNLVTCFCSSSLADCASLDCCTFFCSQYLQKTLQKVLLFHTVQTKSRNGNECSQRTNYNCNRKF